MTVREELDMRRVFVFIMALAWLTGCSSAPGMTESQSLKEKALLEATAIVQRAEATAIVLRAQATADALIQSIGATPTPMVATQATLAVKPTAAPEALLFPTRAATTPPEPAAVITATEEPGQVELLGVGLAAESGFIIVQFHAPPQLARKWIQGNVYVVDEATGRIYNEVPVMPVIGPLFARPKQPGQPGYVMFVNAPQQLKVGALVTVVLGDYKQEHVTVQ